MADALQAAVRSLEQQVAKQAAALDKVSKKLDGDAAKAAKAVADAEKRASKEMKENAQLRADVKAASAAAAASVTALADKTNVRLDEMKADFKTQLDSLRAEIVQVTEAVAAASQEAQASLTSTAQRVDGDVAAVRARLRNTQVGFRKSIRQLDAVNANQGHALDANMELALTINSMLESIVTEQVRWSVLAPDVDVLRAAASSRKAVYLAAPRVDFRLMRDMQLLLRCQPALEPDGSGRVLGWRCAVVLLVQPDDDEGTVRAVCEASGDAREVARLFPAQVDQLVLAGRKYEFTPFQGRGEKVIRLGDSSNPAAEVVDRWVGQSVEDETGVSSRYLWPLADDIVVLASTHLTIDLALPEVSVSSPAIDKYVDDPACAVEMGRSQGRAAAGDDRRETAASGATAASATGPRKTAIKFDSDDDADGDSADDHLNGEQSAPQNGAGENGTTAPGSTLRRVVSERLAASKLAAALQPALGTVGQAVLTVAVADKAGSVTLVRRFGDVRDQLAREMKGYRNRMAREVNWLVPHAQRLAAASATGALAGNAATVLPADSGSCAVAEHLHPLALPQYSPAFAVGAVDGCQLVLYAGGYRSERLGYFGLFVRLPAGARLKCTLKAGAVERLVEKHAEEPSGEYGCGEMALWSDALAGGAGGSASLRVVMTVIEVSQDLLRVHENSAIKVRSVVGPGGGAQTMVREVFGFGQLPTANAALYQPVAAQSARGKSQSGSASGRSPRKYS